MYSYRDIQHQLLAAREIVAAAVARVLPYRHGHDTRLRRARDAAEVADWYSRASEIEAAFGRCRDAIRRFRRSCEMREAGRARWSEGHAELLDEIVGEMAPYDRFLSPNCMWDDLILRAESCVMWSLLLEKNERSEEGSIRG